MQHTGGCSYGPVANCGVQRTEVPANPSNVRSYSASERKQTLRRAGGGNTTRELGNTPRDRNLSRYDLFKMLTLGPERGTPLGGGGLQGGPGCESVVSTVLRSCEAGGDRQGPHNADGTVRRAVCLGEDYRQPYYPAVNRVLDPTTHRMGSRVGESDNVHVSDARIITRGNT